MKKIYKTTLIYIYESRGKVKERELSGTATVVDIETKGGIL